MKTRKNVKSAWILQTRQHGPGGAVRAKRVLRTTSVAGARREAHDRVFLTEEEAR